MIPWGFLLRILGPLAIAIGVFLFGYSSGHANVKREWDLAKAAQVAVDLEAERMVRVAETRKFTAAKGAQDALTANLGKARNDASAARTELGRLLDAAHPPVYAASDPDAAKRAVGSAAAWDVLGECAKALQSLAEDADGLESRLVGWQQWWQAVKP